MERQNSVLHTLYCYVTSRQKEAIRLLCFSLGVLFTICFPKTAKKLSSALAILSVLAMIPSIIKLLADLCRDVKRLRA